jgi:hypothetical protein
VGRIVIRVPPVIIIPPYSMPPEAFTAPVYHPVSSASSQPSHVHTQCCCNKKSIFVS